MSDENNENKDNANATLSADEIKDLIVRTVNGAVTTRLDRERKAQTAQLEGMFKDFASQLTAQKAEEPSGEKTDGGDQMKAVQAKYERQLAEMKAQLDREAKSREEERQKRLVNEERNSLRDALSANGVPPALVQAAVALLHTDQKRLERNEDGSIHFLLQEQSPSGPYVERVGVAEGVERFLKSDEGRYFLPPKPAAGAGSKGGNAPGSNAREGESEADAIARLFDGL